MGRPPSLLIQAESRNGIVRFALAGELDMSTVSELTSALDAVDVDRLSAIVLDLRDLKFIDSTGLHALVKAWTFAQSNGHQLLLVGVQHSAKRLFEISGTEFLMDGQDPVGLLDQFTREPMSRVDIELPADD
jgi:stage II sporulation protein AA (anti-sigma F factor antagonist)